MTAQHQSGSQRPRFPFFKDETGTGLVTRHITLKASVRAIIISVMLGAIVIGLVAWWAIDKVDQLDQLSAQRHSDNLATQAQLEKVIAQNKQDAFNAVAHLACSVVALYPPGTSAFIDQLASTYSCPPYVAPKATPTPQKTTQNPGQNSASNTPRAHAAGALPSPTVDRPVDTPTPTTLPGPPVPTPTPTPLIDLGTAACRLLGLLC